MIYNRKVKLLFSNDNERILDGQSKICNWLYNQLLDLIQEDVKNCDNCLKLLQGRNLRDMVPIYKEAYPFLKTVHSSPLKNVAFRLADSYDRFFKKQCAYPKFRKYKDKWFSLYFDESNKGFKLMDSRNLRISLGKGEDGKQMHVEGILGESLKLKEKEILKTFRLCKQQGGKFYGIFTIEAVEPLKKPIKSWIAIDQNHKNFFVAVDSEGTTFEFAKLHHDSYFDGVIDKMKSKRDKCNRKHKQKTSASGVIYYVPNKRYEKINHALNKAYSRKREQNKQSMYAIAHFIAKNYDKAIIGDYVPTKDIAALEGMHRCMLNQAHIGEFRKILEWVMTKSGKSFVKVSEENTTKECCICGDMQKKAPEVREYTCPMCNAFFLRDINSAINIAKKDNKVPNLIKLDQVDKVGKYNYKLQRLMVM